MYKTIVTLTLALIGLSTSFAQVGIGTPDPDASAMLDVDSPDKGFLPPRMETPPTDPATGLIIYNTIENCLQVNVGTPTTPDWQCFDGSGGGTGGSGGSSGTINGNYWQASNLRFEQFGITNHPSNEYYSWGITADGDLYMWGRDASTKDALEDLTGTTNQENPSPVYADYSDANGTLVKNVKRLVAGRDFQYILLKDGKLYSRGEQAFLGRGLTSTSIVEPPGIVPIPAGATAWVDLAYTFDDNTFRSNMVALADDGEMYITGSVNATSYTDFRKMARPTGVNSWVKCWMTRASNDVIYLLGDNGKVYGTNKANVNTAGNFSVASTTTAINYNPLVSSGFWEIQLPYPTGGATGAGVIDSIIKIESNGTNTVALDSDGEVYGWGGQVAYLAFSNSAHNKYIPFDDAQMDAYVPNYHKVYEPKLVPNSTNEKVIDVSFLGSNLLIVTETGKAYFCGVFTNFDQLSYWNAIDGPLQRLEDYILVKDFAHAGINLTALKGIGGSSSGSTILGLDANGVLWGVGKYNFAAIGAFGDQGYPVPILNGNLDPNNLNPEP